MSQILIGNAPCSWGTLEFGSTKGDRFTYTQMLDELAASGYAGSELGDWGFLPTDPVALSDEFQRRDLALTGAFVGVALRDRASQEEGAQLALKTAHLLAQVAPTLGSEITPFLVLADDNGVDPVRTQNAGRVAPSMGMTAEEWRIFASGVDSIARAVLGETGLRTVFHHHCAGFVETPDEIQRLLDSTDPELVGLVFDTGHYAFGAGGCDTVVDALNRYGDRIWYIHFKDCQPDVMRQARERQWDYFDSVRHGVFCELGEGCVEFVAVYEWLQARQYAGFITVEQDILPGMGAPKESAERNRRYLRSIGL